MVKPLPLIDCRFFFSHCNLPHFETKAVQYYSRTPILIHVNELYFVHQKAKLVRLYSRNWHRGLRDLHQGILCIRLSVWNCWYKVLFFKHTCNQHLALGLLDSCHRYLFLIFPLSWLFTWFLFERTIRFMGPSKWKGFPLNTEKYRKDFPEDWEFQRCM